MKAKDLRLGNIIIWDNEYYEVKRSFWDQYKDDESDIEFVPITKEFLVRLGISFRNGCNEMCYYDYLDFEFYNNELYLTIDGDKFSRELKYIHEVQNFVYELARIELTFKD